VAQETLREEQDELIEKKKKKNVSGLYKGQYLSAIHTGLRKSRLI
jgi:hypothetical protein